MMAIEAKEKGAEEYKLDEAFEDTAIYDSVTEKLMQNPVTNTCGHIFDKTTAEKIAAQSKEMGGQCCSFCRAELTHNTFKPNAQLKQLIDKLRKYSAETESTITQLHERIIELEKQDERGLQTEIALLKQSLENSKDFLAEKEGALIELREQLQALQSGFAELNKKNIQLQNTLTLEKHEHIRSLATINLLKENEVSQLTQQTRELHEQLLWEQKNRKGLQLELQNLKSSISTRNQQIEQLKQQIKEFQTETICLNRELAKLNRNDAQKKIGELSEKLTNKSREMSRLNQEINDLKDKWQKISDSEENLRGCLEKKSAEFSALALQLAKLNAEKEQLMLNMQALKKNDQTPERANETKVVMNPNELPRPRSKKNELQKLKDELALSQDECEKARASFVSTNRKFKIFALPMIIVSVLYGRELWNDSLSGRVDVMMPKLTVREEVFKEISSADAGEIERFWKSGIESSENHDPLQAILAYDHLLIEYSPVLPKIFLEDIYARRAQELLNYSKKSPSRVSVALESEIENDSQTTLLTERGFFREGSQRLTISGVQNNEPALSR
ncbi:MAG: U-box domain [Gammaproteobacteria bacterium]|nr:U-box domain [Gammaproteobacteria bacterium]